jgi:hypothetical protein
MIYALAITAIVAGCALALDRVAEIWGASRRTIWLAALTISILIPLGLAMRPVRGAPVASATTNPPQNPVRFSAQALPNHGNGGEVRNTHEFFLTRLSGPTLLGASWNRLAGLAWLIASVVLVALLVRGVIWLWREQTRWHRSVVDGHSVFLTGDVGPAVVGAFRPRILLPSWALTLGDDERALMLEHEAQHARARDPLLIAIASWSIALFPWNPAVWFIVKRLRLAIEVDCDRRVLAGRTAEVREYGLLLLTVGARCGGALQFGASLAEPRRFLEQRILAMTMSRPSRPIAASLPFVAISVLAAVAVAQTPRPDSTLIVREAPPRPAHTRAPAPIHEQPIAAPPTEPRVPFPRIEKGGRLPFMDPSRTELAAPPKASTVHPLPLSIELVRAWIQLHHPNVIAGDPRVNAVTIVVDQNDQYLSSVADSIAGVGFAADTISLRLRGTLQPISTVTPRPVIVVDGIRVDSTAQLDTIPIESIEVLKGRYAADAYGPDAENGVIAIRSMRPDPGSLSRLGLIPDNVAEMSELRVRPGVIGPNRLYIAVLRLKKY